MDKHVFVQLNGARKVTGVLRGFDPFMNLVLDEAVEEVSPTEKKEIGMVVRYPFFDAFVSSLFEGKNKKREQIIFFVVPMRFFSFVL